MIQQSGNKLKISSYFLILLFSIFFIFKYRFFINLFPGTDQSFYIKWVIDLTNSNHFFPSGEKSFYLNLFSDSNSFLHNYCRRIYNDIGVLYNFIPIIINLIIGKILNYNFLIYNFNSILINCLIPLIISNHLIKDKKFGYIEKTYVLAASYLFVSSFFSFFFLAPLGIHNYGILFLIFSIIIIEKRIDDVNLISLKTIIYGILIPCFSHKFNIIIIFTSLFLIIIYRILNNYRYKKDLLILIFLFFLIISPIFIFSFFGDRNVELLKIFFYGSSEISKFNLIDLISVYFLENFINSLKNFSFYFWNNFSFLGTFLLIISLFNKKNVITKIFLTSTFLLFIILPLDPYIGRLFNYFLILSIFLICKYVFEFSSKNQFINNGIRIIFIMMILLNFIPLIFEKNQNDFQKNLANKYPNSKIWNEKINKIIEIVGDENILFYQYLARDVYYSAYNKIDNDKNVYSTPSIYDLSNKYMNNKHQYIKKINFDKNKFKNSYILYFGSEQFEKDLNERFCYLQKKFFQNCSNLKIVNYSSIKKPIVYEGNTHVYVLNLYKTLN